MVPEAVISHNEIVCDKTRQKNKIKKMATAVEKYAMAILSITDSNIHSRQHKN